MGSRYSGAEHLLRWLMLNLLTASAAVLFGARLVPNNRERKYLASVAAGAVANIGLNLVFIPRYGAIAAVFTTIAAQGVVAAMEYYFTRDLEQANFTRPLTISFIATAVMIGAILLTQHVAQWNVVILIGGGAIVYGLSTLALQALWKQFARPREAVAAAHGGAE